MNIIKNKKIVNSFGRYIDLLNTLNGGVSMAQMQVLKKKNRLEVLVKAPTVKPESLQVVVDYNKLIIYGVLPVQQDNAAAQLGLSMPLFSNIMPIPFEIDVANIRAIHEDGILKVVLPFDEGRRLNKQAIQIEER